VEPVGQAVHLPHVLATQFFLAGMEAPELPRVKAVVVVRLAPEVLAVTVVTALELLESPLAAAAAAVGHL
jgi:hypothetical protein